jgi:transcriptional regulator with XRE-family HTH domain
MFDDATIAVRLRVLRKIRGMSLEQLAGLSDLSKGFLSQIENGKSALDRRSHISAVAAALRVSEVDLVGGPHLSHDPVQLAPHAHVPALRMALRTNSLAKPAVERARPVDELAIAMNRIEARHQACDFTAVGDALPDVIDELYLHTAAPADEAAHLLALGTLVEACTAAVFTAKDLGYPDLAALAAVRAEEAAAALDDPVRQGEAAFCRIHTLPSAGSWTRTMAAAERAADQLQSEATGPRGMQVLGMLTLSASLAAAVNVDAGRANDWIDEAVDLARRMPDVPEANWMSFSATNVYIWDVAVNVECGERGGAVLERAGRVNEEKLVNKPGRRAAFLVDIGRGLARDRRTRQEAVTWLRRGEDAAPQWIRNHALARETVTMLLSQVRAEPAARELRAMAARMGISH